MKITSLEPSKPPADWAPWGPEYSLTGTDVPRVPVPTLPTDCAAMIQVPACLPGKEPSFHQVSRDFLRKSFRVPRPEALLDWSPGLEAQGLAGTE